MKSPNLHFSVETLGREHSRANPKSSSMAEQEDGDYAFNLSSPPMTKPPRVASMSTRLQSPTSHPFHLGSNDDQLERAQARAARAAAIRRKPTAPPPPSHSGDHVLFDKNQIMELYHNCIKLASENVWEDIEDLLFCLPVATRGLFSLLFVFCRKLTRRIHGSLAW